MDANAQTAPQANERAITDTTACINTIAALPGPHRSWIKTDYASILAATNLYKCQPTPNKGWTAVVVEVNTHYSGVRGNGVRYTVTCLLDVDIPPPESTQRPHFGWEVEFNEARVGNGHVWLPVGVLQAGRPPPGAGLETYSYEGNQEKTFEGNGRVERECHFRRYR